MSALYGFVHQHVGLFIVHVTPLPCSFELNGFDGIMNAQS